MKTNGQTGKKSVYKYAIRKLCSRLREVKLYLLAGVIAWVVDGNPMWRVLRPGIAFRDARGGGLVGGLLLVGQNVWHTLQYKRRI